MTARIEDAIQAFFSRYKQLQFRRTEILIRADDDPLGVYCLNEGYIRQYVISEKGNEVILDVIKPVCIFPLAWALNNSPNTCFYETITPARAYRAPKDEFMAFIKTDPEVPFYLLSITLDNAERFLDHTAHLMASSVYTRLIEELITHARRLGKKGKGNTYTFEFKVIERGIAGIVGTTPETVSRELKVLKDLGLVTLNKNMLTINDIVKLENELLENS
jgi:CRP/FNR family transcriptional regulator, anaerobic regulatory protein